MAKVKIEIDNDEILITQSKIKQPIKFESLSDQMKFEFVMENFDKLKQEDIEHLLAAKESEKPEEITIEYFGVDDILSELEDRLSTISDRHLKRYGLQKLNEE